MQKDLDELYEQIYRLYDERQYASLEHWLQKLEKYSPLEAQDLRTCAAVERGDIEQARLEWKKLQAIAPHNPKTRFLQARIQYMEGTSASLLRDLESLAADVAMEVYRGKLYNLLGRCYREWGHLQEAVDSNLKASQLAVELHEKRLDYSNYLFDRHYLPYDEEKERGALQGYAALYKHQQQFLHRQCGLNGKKKLRLGILSSDLRKHVVLRFSYQLIVNYDKEKYEVYVYSLSTEDKYSRLLADNVDVWRNIMGLPPEEAARKIYADGVDILVDLNGHTQNNGLEILAYKPAPVQVSGIGYWSSIGLPQVDYFLGDKVIDGEGEDAFFTERLLRLPHSHFCFLPLQSPPLPEQSAFERNGYITFGCFNGFAKVNDHVLSLWGEILNRCPQSRLLLKAAVFDQEDMKQHHLQRIAQYIPLDRVIVRGITDDYLPEYGDMDIALDTFPYPGGGTTCDALYMGIPVVSRYGSHHGERFGLGILTNAGIAELAAESDEKYVELALSLAADKDLLAYFHKNLRSMLQKSPLMDKTIYQQELDEIWQSIWQVREPSPKLKPEQIMPSLQQMEAYAADGDIRQAMAIADRITLADTADREVLSRLAVVYMDGQDSTALKEVIQQLERLGNLSGWQLFFKAGLADLEHDGDSAIAFAQEALQDEGLQICQQGVVHHFLANLYKLAGSLSAAAQEYRLSAECKDVANGKLVEYSNYLLHLQYTPVSAEQYKLAAQKYQDMLPDKMYKHQRDRHRYHEKIRVGYISPDICRHVVSSFMGAQLTKYNKKLFEVYVYTNCTEDEISQQYKKEVTDWCNFRGWTEKEIAKRIYHDEIDILIDLSGHTAGNSLPVLAMKPAPIQISGIGYFATTGVHNVDYFLTDNYLAEEQEGGHFIEKMLFMPQSHLCYTPVAKFLRQQVLPAPCHRNGYITLGSFNNFSKVTDAVLAVWSGIMQQLSDSMLYLKAKLFDNPYGRRKAEERLQQAGIDLKRVRMEGYSEDYIDAYADVDIALDTWPYPGGGTTCDAIYMGVPVVVMAGNNHHSRFGKSILANLELLELYAENEQDYISKTVTLAQDKPRLTNYHQTLKRRMRQSPLMNQMLYIIELENIYGHLWAEWTRKKLPSQEKIKNNVQAEKWPELLHQESINWWHQKADYVTLENLAIAYYHLDDYYRTIYWSQQAIDAEPLRNMRMYYAKAKAKDEIGELLSALRTIEEALEMDFWQKDDEGYRGLLNVQANILFKIGDNRAAEAFRQVHELYKTINEKTKCDAYSSYLLCLHSLEISNEELFQVHKDYSLLFSEVVPYQHKRSRHQHEKIRVGYISPDFRWHVMYRFYMVFLSYCNADDFSVYCYNLNRKDDEVTAVIKSVVMNWRDMRNLSYHEIAEQIYQDEIDILVDLAGHSADSGLPALSYKPAPVQISGLGYMFTTGLPTVDYFLTDRNVDGDELSEQLMVEKPLYLESQFCYQPLADMPEPTGTACKQRGWLLFGVFNRYSKITDEMLLAWREILARVPRSKLLLKCQVFMSLEVQDSAYERLKALGFDMDRVILEPASIDYMERYLDVDIALDTYPYTGGGTTCDALYMGVPVVTMYGRRRGTRFSYGILKTIGLEALAVDNMERYVDCTVNLALDEDFLEALHKQIRPMMLAAKIMSPQAYMEEVERAYHGIWQKAFAEMAP
ncbi:O-linked N-acetylglucosamine transferase, SPINDLY family protein [Selenomonas ruminantium]|uniref:Predicted O-linked N-acetylglucosamine transferase, SPINDLY family n=1 Tax=Selenomonas ruminantium TaxID=971 RepID=A0A1I0YKB0_SELRU|nr:hypothetical protein [Selenomonas ruminantium]SFB13631.1 Predicted O-linked N-acetylglucosamine transferase, SPINDLY family [Selenomonas ruminantium]